jgi:hypothetical protein
MWLLSVWEILCCDWQTDVESGLLVGGKSGNRKEVQRCLEM